MTSHFRELFGNYLKPSKDGAWKRRYIRFMARFKRLPLFTFGLVTGVVAVSGSVLLMSIVFSIFPTLADADISYTASLESAFYLILLGPILETFLLALIIFLIQKFINGIYLTALISACVWGILHGLDEPGRFFGTIWSFYLFSLSYIWWRKRTFAKGIYAACLPHMVLNGIICIVMWANFP